MFLGLYIKIRTDNETQCHGYQQQHTTAAFQTCETFCENVRRNIGTQNHCTICPHQINHLKQCKTRVNYPTKNLNMLFIIHRLESQDQHLQNSVKMTAVRSGWCWQTNVSISTE